MHKLAEYLMLTACCILTDEKGILPERSRNFRAGSPLLSKGFAAFSKELQKQPIFD
jgi:hypothetical protein